MEAQLREQKAEAAEVKKPNLTGIPTQMKLDFEQRSGLSFDDVRVHYNSDKPARLGALAYTQGTQIHVGPGHESSLPHELGHVIQQKAGRVRPTRWINGLPVNDQPELEREADLAPVQCMPAPALWGVVQMCTEDEINSLMARFAENRWTEIDREYCIRLIKMADTRNPPRIGNRFARLHRIKGGILRIEYKRFSGVGPMGRLAKEGGTECQITDLPTERWENVSSPFQSSITLDHPPAISPRRPLNTIMGGSASKLSKIDNSEYCHMVGHQIGGADSPENLMTGPHALNTAMIPVENLVADLATCGVTVQYSVKMLPHPGPALWASTVDMDIKVINDSNVLQRSFQLEVTGDITDRLSKESYDLIQAHIDGFREEIDKFLYG